MCTGLPPTDWLSQTHHTHWCELSSPAFLSSESLLQLLSMRTFLTCAPSPQLKINLFLLEKFPQHQSRVSQCNLHQNDCIWFIYSHSPSLFADDTNVRFIYNTEKLVQSRKHTWWDLKRIERGQCVTDWLYQPPTPLPSWNKRHSTVTHRGARPPCPRAQVNSENTGEGMPANPY